MATDPLIAPLKKIKPLPVVTPTSAWPNRIIQDPELCFEMSRVLRCASTSLRWATPSQIQKLVDSKPEHIALNWSPWNDKFQGAKWRKEEVFGRITSKDLRYMTYFLEKALRAKEIIGDIPVITMFDHEPNVLKGTASKFDGARVGRLNTFQRIAKAVFSGDVGWYNDGQHIPGPGASTKPRKASPLPDGVSGDFASLSMYRNIYSTWCMETLRYTAEATERDLCVWVSVGGVYELWPWTPRGSNRRSPDVTWVPQLGETWYAGWWLYHKFPRKFSGRFGPVNRVKYVMLWPPPLRLGDEHLLEFFGGAHGMRRSQ